MAMKNKKDLLIAAIALVSILFIAILLIASGALKSGTQEENAEDTVVLENGADSQEEVLPTEETERTPSESVNEENVFTFTADGFAKQFAEALPEGYAFSKEASANPERDHRMQLDILNETGTETDIAIVFAGEGSGSQMALTIKEDCIPDDADAILKWYLFTFLEGYTEEKKKAIYDDYLYLFDTGSKEYRVYTEEDVTAMMSLEAEADGNYYYVMVSAE